MEFNFFSKSVHTCVLPMGYRSPLVAGGGLPVVCPVGSPHDRSSRSGRSVGKLADSRGVFHLILNRIDLSNVVILVVMGHWRMGLRFGQNSLIL